MSGIGYWLGGGEALIVIGLCWLLMKYGHHLPGAAHPWLHRLVILGMYAAGLVLSVTTIGLWVLGKMRWLGGLTGGTDPGHGLAWALVVVGGIALIFALVVALVWSPNLGVAYIALLAPLLLALAPGGFPHQVYAVTAAPAQSAVAQVATWAGG
jgi:hypothetical protein